MVHAFAIVIPHRHRHWLGNFNQQQLQWRHNNKSFLHSSINDTDEESWGFENDNNLNKDARLNTLRSILESSWNQPTMGIVPTTPTNAAIAATECISNAMTSSSSTNIMMIDLRLPSYDIIEGQRAYDTMAVYNFGVELAHRMEQIGLVRKSLLLVRNGRECEEIKRVLNRRRQRKKINNDDEYENDDDDEDNLLRKWTKEEEADEFRKKLMSSWESSSYEDNALVSSTSSYSKSDSSEGSKVIIDNTNSASHRLWSMVGNELNYDIDKSSSSVVDTFNDIIAAVDIHARLQTNEDAIIILSPYDTTDIVALRRILSRYGSTKRSTPIIIVNSRLDTNPTELDNALLVYGMLPLVAKAVRQSSSSSRAEMEEDDSTTNTPGLRAVIMKRYPKDWTVYVDVNGDGFVEAMNDNDRSGIGGGTTQSFPSPEWIAQRVQAHVEGLLRRRDMQ
jgi:hypothetical protein